jgi:hypothetical protein
MKLKAVSLIVLLFAGNAAASSVKLVCDVVVPHCSSGDCWESDETRQIEFDEEAGFVKYTEDNKWKTGKKPKFEEDLITAKFSNGLAGLGTNFTLKIDRITGHMKETFMGNSFATGPCKVVPEFKRAF